MDRKVGLVITFAIAGWMKGCQVMPARTALLFLLLGIAGDLGAVWMLCTAFGV